MIELLNVDCMDYMATLPDKALDLCSDLDIGKAGEYLVCADLILKGFTAYPSEQGLPYDVVLDNGNKLLKVQVKTTTGPRKIPQRSKESFAYIFNIKIAGKHKKKRNDNDVDLYALVCLDTMKVGYITGNAMPTTINIRVDSLRGTYYDEDSVNTFRKVQELRKEYTQTEIAKKLNKHIAVINRMFKDGYKPFKTNARYFSDFIRDRGWLSGL